MSEIFFTDDHEYIKIEGDAGTVGISDYAQEALGDIVYIETPKVGAKLAKGEEAGVVESVKSASEIYAPVTGEILEINGELATEPALVNSDALDKGWLYKIKIENKDELSELKNESAYKAYIESL